MVIEKLAEVTGVDRLYVQKIINSASHRYKAYNIKKRSGGTRLIEHPSKEVKALQRIATNLFLNNLQIHYAVKSYRKGVSIRDNAKEHVENKYLLRLDFQDFFNSITKKTIISYFKKSLPKLSSADHLNLANLFCREGHLVIGAPSSPVLSNIILFDFDKDLASKMEKLGISYTRYADDMIFSTSKKDILYDISETVESLCKIHKLPLKLNYEKSVYTSSKRKKAVTGLLLTPDGKISVGRKRKRALKTKFFLFIQGKLDEKQARSLKGELAYLHSVEPSFLFSLARKFEENFNTAIKKLNELTF